MRNHINILAIFCLIFTGIIIYSNTVHSSFHFDDVGNIVENTSIRNLKNLCDIKAIFKPNPTRFITYLSIAIDYHFSQLDTFGYHIFNIAVHICAAIMVWWLVILTLNTPMFRGEKIVCHSKIIAFFAALIFIAHPLQTQAVTYITQRAASLATLFYVASLALYVKSRLLRQARDVAYATLYYILSFLAVILAMFSKEMTITLPFMILLYELCFFREEGIDWKRVLPFFAAIIIIPMMKSVNFEKMYLVRENSTRILPWQYLLTQFRVIVTYIRLLFVPIHQNLDYDYSISNTLFDVTVLSSLLLLSLIFTAAVKIFRRYRLVSFGIFWFFLTLALESSIVPLRDVIFEHRLYLPMVGYAIFLVGTIYYVFENKSIKPFIIILFILGISYSILTYSRNFIWKDEFTLWNDVINKSPNKNRPYNNRGNAYGAKGDYDKAISDYNKSIELNPNFYLIYNNRGNAYSAKGNHDQAISDYNKAIERNPKFAKAYSNRGVAYGAKGDYDQAISDYTKSIDLEPNYPKVYSNRGNAYGAKGDYDNAISDYDKAIELNPNYAKAYNNRAIMHYYNQEYDEAWDDVNKAESLGCKVNPRFLDRLTEESGREK